jgi:ring-1,2-phenylacetyl-CoA epoxidase subunit PaaE
MDQLQLRVIQIKRETRNAATIILERADGKALLYKAGQFLTLLIVPKGIELRRSYSISSTPHIDNFVSITVKRIPNGEVSRWLLDRLRAGDLLISLPPAGRFTIETHFDRSRQFFFIAAGSGIIPVFSLIKKILSEEPLSHVILLDQNSDRNDIIFDSQLQILRKSSPASFKWINLLSRPRKQPPFPERLNNFSLDKLVRDNLMDDKEQSFYMCGPASFMRMAQFTLRLMGYADEQIKKESFTVEYIPPPPPIRNHSLREIIIHRDNQVFLLKAAYPKNILQAALDNHIPLPYSCRGGRCSSCIARLMKGKVKMSVNEVLTEKELQDGWILTCVGYAETDVELCF